jgi:hypothetical protein
MSTQWHTNDAPLLEGGGQMHVQILLSGEPAVSWRGDSKVWVKDKPKRVGQEMPQLSLQGGYDCTYEIGAETRYKLTHAHADGIQSICFWPHLHRTVRLSM